VTITWITPVSGQPFGPGFHVSVSSDFIGPLPQGSFWDIRLLPDPESPESNRWGWKITTTGPSTDGVLGFDEGIRALEPGESDLVHGQDAFLQARLMQDIITVLDSGTIPVRADFTTGVPFLYGGATATGGFTENDRIMLAQVNASAVPAIFWWLAGQITPELISLLAGRLRTPPGARLIGDFGEGPHSFGGPEIGTFFKWVGIEWALMQHAEGIGTDEGNPQTTEISWGQISRLRRTSSGEDIIDETWYEARRHGSSYWGTEEPSGIALYVMPSVVVRMSWLIQLEPVELLHSSPRLPTVPHR
jgi:hypothetical protein